VGTKPYDLGVYIDFLLYEGKRGRYLYQQYSTRLGAWGADGGYVAHHTGPILHIG
jgi:hypothetical protein